MNQSMVSPGKFVGLVAVLTSLLLIFAATDDSTAADNWAPSSSTSSHR